jgi:hypothetical protein
VLTVTTTAQSYARGHRRSRVRDNDRNRDVLVVAVVTAVVTLLQRVLPAPGHGPARDVARADVARRHLQQRVVKIWYEFFGLFLRLLEVGRARA